MQNIAFDNAFLRALPGDPSRENNRRQIQNAIYAWVNPTQVPAPKLVAYAHEAAQILNLSEADCASEDFVQVFSGNKILPGMAPHATCYGGHQFGNWAGQLGDGRAINLGEVNTDSGHWMLQLKGAGPTPFSRTADGLAVLRSSIREFLCSEAMFHLGVPTTRALSLITTGDQVMRDMLYDGNAALEPGAVVCRMSPSFVRFGHFQLLAARQEIDLLRQFTEYVINRDFPHLLSNTTEVSNNSIVAWFEEVCERTALLMVDWMRVGFVHGVMNTDNMSILGETIDYGPYGWLEDFDPDWTPNTTDAGQRRYRYGQQPAIGQWNLVQLANAILPLLSEAKPLEDALSHYAKTYEQSWQRMMADKLGLATVNQSLVDRLLNLLVQEETDMTLFFRNLAAFAPNTEAGVGALTNAYYRDGALPTHYLEQRDTWLSDYAGVLAEQRISEEQRQRLMKDTNPKYVLRNYLAQLAIDDAHQGDFHRIHKLLDVLRRPYDDQPENETFAAKRPEWARTKVGCSMLSCSS